MSIIQEKANAIAADMAKNEVEHHVALDPQLIVDIIGVVVGVIQILMQCFMTPKQAQLRMANPGVVEKWRLRRVVRSQLDDDEMNNYVGAKIVQSSINVSKSLTIEEVTAMYEEVQQKENQ